MGSKSGAQLRRKMEKKGGKKWKEKKVGEGRKEFGPNNGPQASVLLLSRQSPA